MTARVTGPRLAWAVWLWLGLPAPDAPLHRAPLAAAPGTRIDRVWANEGGDKVTRDELRATADPEAVRNAVWDGSSLSLFGARNEVVSFNLVLEAATATATGVSVSLTTLSGPGGATIGTRPVAATGLFDYVGRNIELFYVRYLDIKGLSVDLAYDDYDERHVPERCRRPHDGRGDGRGGWTDRPCHDRSYPEIAVPLELHTPFTIEAGTNQSIWGDLYIPKSARAGLYTGTIAIAEAGATTWRIPIRLRVRRLTLPDLPSARTMVYYSAENVSDRYLGQEYPDPGTSAYGRALAIADRHFQLAHRHKISLIDEETDRARLGEAWTARLSGGLFTAARGYAGVGVGVGNNVFSIGTYGSWPWRGGARADMWRNADAWVEWFDRRAFTTPTEYFLYLIDESDDFPQIQQWAEWIDRNPGPGRRLLSLATLDLTDARASVPSLDVAASATGAHDRARWDADLRAWRSDRTKRFYLYNGTRPFSGSFATEDDGVALRALAWGQYKRQIDRWFYWESTYYNNFQGNTGHTNVFRQAQTYGTHTGFHPTRGESGYNYFNGDGVLFYPGTDTRFPADSYGVSGPLASLRLKHWRRGIQDVDYLVKAASVDPVRTVRLVRRMVPKVFWEYGVSDPSDPTWVRADISWSTDPDRWEAARAELADIIEAASAARP